MPFIPDEEQPDAFEQSSQTPTNLSNSSNPILNKLNDPNTPLNQKKAIVDVMKGEAQNQKGLLDKFLSSKFAAGINSVGDFFDKKVFFGKGGFGDISSKSAGRLAGDFAGTAVEATSKVLADTGVIDKPVDYGFQKDLDEITSSPSNIAKVWGMAALEMWPGGAGKGAIKEASTELASKIPGIGGGASKVVGGAFDVANKVIDPIKGAGSKAVNAIKSKISIPKIAEFFTNVAAKNFDFIKKNPELFAKAKDLAEDETIIPSFGKRLFDLSKNLSRTASNEWKATEAKILQTAEKRLGPAVKTLQQNVGNVLEENKIVSTVNEAGEKVLDFTKSSFSQNSTAQGILGRLQRIISTPAESVDDLLTKRTEVTDLVNEIGKTDRNLKRVVNNVVDTFDIALDKMTNGQSTALRESYKSKINPARKVMDAMTDSKGRFSLDRATNYVKQLISDAKFDSKEAVEELQKQLADAGISKADLTKEAQSLAVAKKTSQIAPPTGSRVKDVVMSYGITKIPIISALASPKFWAEAIERGGSKVSRTVLTKIANGIKDDVSKLLMQKVLTTSIDNAFTKNAEAQKSEQSNLPMNSDMPSPNFVPDEEQGTTDSTSPNEDTAPNENGVLDPNANENGQIFFW